MSLELLRYKWGNYFIVISVVLLLLLAWILSYAFLTNFKLGIIVLISFVIFLILLDPRIGFFLLICSLPFKRVWDVYVVFNLKVTYWIFAATFISWFGRRLIKGELKFKKTLIDLPLICFLGVAAISIFQSYYIPPDANVYLGVFRNLPWIKSITRVCLLIFMIFLYYFVVNFVNSKKMVKYVILVLLLSSTLVSLYGLYGFTDYYVDKTPLVGYDHNIVESPIESSPPRVRSTEHEPLFFGNYLISLLPLFFSLFFLKKKLINRKLLWLIVLINTLALVLTFSRGVWFSFIVAMCFFSLFYRKNLFRYKKTIFVCFVLFIILIFVKSNLFITPIVGIFDQSSLTFWSTKTRIITIKYGIEAFKLHPILGVGYANYNFYSENNIYPLISFVPFNWPETNNYPVKILAEMGIIGFLVFSWLFFSILRSCYLGIKHTKDIFYRNLLIGLFAAFIGVSVQLMFFSVIEIVYLWFMLGLMMAIIRLSKEGENDKKFNLS